MGRHPHHHRKSASVDTTNFPILTICQAEDVFRTATTHRPSSLIDIISTPGSIYVQAVSADGRTTFGEWRIETRGSTLFLRVVVGDTMYVEVLEEQMALRWCRAMSGLRSWAKAVNAVELDSILAQRPEFAHITASNIMDPKDYSPLGRP